MFSINRRMVLALICGLGFSTINAAQAAVNIRYFVVQSTGLFEIKGSTGGKFVIQPTGEVLNVQGLGARSVRGYTDRIVRGEYFVAKAEGSGPASVKVTYVNQSTGGIGYILPLREIPNGLPYITPQFQCPLEWYKDDVNATIFNNGTTTVKRLPIGTR